MRIREIMTEKVDYADPGASIVDLASRMRDEGVGAVPIAEDDKLVGMVTDRDIVVRGVAGGENIEARTARDVMTDEMLWCNDEQPIEEVLHNMGEQQVRRLAVVNSDKRLVGVISLGDLARHVDAANAGEALQKISRA
jgi:CBS domain-containing protein